MPPFASFSCNCNPVVGFVRFDCLWSRQNWRSVRCVPGDVVAILLLCCGIAAVAVIVVVVMIAPAVIPPAAAAAAAAAVPRSNLDIVTQDDGTQ